VIPAIDLRGGRVVRLEQGDFERETAFGDDPAEQARIFAGAGAHWIHVVDLDGARDGRPRQTAAISGIVAAAGGAAIEVAGGLRTARSVAAALEAGASRIVLGTVAITNPQLVAEVVARHGSDAVAVALDVRGGQAVGGGWLAEAPAGDVSSVVEQLAVAGVRTWIVTAIDRDGLLGGPDLELLENVIATTGAAVIASGGVTTLDDLRAVRRIGCAGAIVGRAIYDGQLDLAAAIASSQEQGA
jgi:phosphoribosylformimino-5-aminoimidazole carboxamide ribotide isomerase